MSKKPVQVLIYKRTHIGDPDETGAFGMYECMGQVRAREFDAVIGVGGIGPEAVRFGIDRKVNWIGIGRHQIGVASDGYPLLAFEQFYLKDAKGPLLSDKARGLAKRLLATHGPRTIMLDSDKEIDAILRLARSSPPSPALLRGTQTSDSPGNSNAKKRKC